jgi:hypothetical protein
MNPPAPASTKEMLSRIPASVRTTLEAAFHMQVEAAYIKQLNDKLATIQARVPQLPTTPLRMRLSTQRMRLFLQHRHQQRQQWQQRQKRRWHGKHLLHLSLRSSKNRQLHVVHSGNGKLRTPPPATTTIQHWPRPRGQGKPTTISLLLMMTRISMKPPNRRIRLC